MLRPLRLGVNVDHVATLRNARGGAHPCPVRAAQAAAGAGADGITAHLREDRRHIRDADLPRLKDEVPLLLNLEMAATDEMVAIAERLRPHAVCLVPERRHEVTTEGGLDVVGAGPALRESVARLAGAGIRVSLFIDPDPAQIVAAHAVGADTVELHTGAFCAAETGDARQRSWRHLVAGARHADALGLEVHAGHGLDFVTAGLVARIPELVELNIGHYLVGEALFLGWTETVLRMRRTMAAGRAAVGAAAA